MRRRKKTPSPASASNPCELADCLRELLDPAGTHTRPEWCSALGVKSSAISQWIHGDTIPKPATLAKIWDVVNKGRAPAEALQRFHSMAAKPAAEVSPHGKRLGESVAAYLNGPRFEDLWNRCRRMRLGEQERVFEAAWRLLQEIENHPKASQGDLYPDIRRGLPEQEAFQYALRRLSGAGEQVRELARQAVGEALAQLRRDGRQKLSDLSAAALRKNSAAKVTLGGVTPFLWEYFFRCEGFQLETAGGEPVTAEGKKEYAAYVRMLNPAALGRGLEKPSC